MVFQFENQQFSHFNYFKKTRIRGSFYSISKYKCIFSITAESGVLQSFIALHIFTIERMVFDKTYQHTIPLFQRRYQYLKNET